MVESKLHDEMIPCFLVPVPGVCSLICLGSLSRVVVGLVGLLTPLYHFGICILTFTPGFFLTHTYSYLRLTPFFSLTYLNLTLL